MSSIADLIQSKMDKEGLNLTAAADAVGVSQPSLRRVLKGASVPNARSVGRYAKFLGLSDAEIAELISAAKGKPAKGKAKGKPGRPPGKKRGRPPGKAAGKKRGRPPGKKPGRPPGAAKRGRPAGRKAAAGGGDVGAALSTLASALAQAEVLLSDELVQKVLQADKKERELISTILR